MCTIHTTITTWPPAVTSTQQNTTVHSRCSVHGDHGSVHGDHGSVHGDHGSVHGDHGSVHGDQEVTTAHLFL